MRNAETCSNQTEHSKHLYPFHRHFGTTCCEKYVLRWRDHTLTRYVSVRFCQNSTGWTYWTLDRLDGSIHLFDQLRRLPQVDLRNALVFLDHSGDADAFLIQRYLRPPEFPPVLAPYQGRKNPARV